MASRRFWEICGFAIIATALHVSAAAVMIPDISSPGASGEAPQIALAAGSPEIEALVATWGAPPAPDIQIANTIAPESPAEGELPPPPLVEATPMPRTPRPALAAPASPAAAPNLPAPPMATIALPDLPPRQGPPPRLIETRPEPVLTASARPQPRPDHPAPPREPRTAAKPQTQDKAGTQRSPQPVAAAQKAGGTGAAKAGSRPAASGGLSAGQQARQLAAWQRQIGACLARSVSRVSRVSGAGTTMNLRIGRNGRVQAAQLARSTGNARLDRDIVARALRARCPAAPAGLTAPSYPAQLPIGIR